MERVVKKSACPAVRAGEMGYADERRPTRPARAAGPSSGTIDGSSARARPRKDGRTRNETASPAERPARETLGESRQARARECREERLRGSEFHST